MQDPAIHNRDAYINYVNVVKTDIIVLGDVVFICFSLSHGISLTSCVRVSSPHSSFSNTINVAIAQDEMLNAESRTFYPVSDSLHFFSLRFTSLLWKCTHKHTHPPLLSLNATLWDWTLDWNLMYWLSKPFPPSIFVFLSVFLFHSVYFHPTDKKCLEGQCVDSKPWKRLRGSPWSV